MTRANVHYRDHPAMDKIYQKPEESKKRGNSVHSTGMRKRQKERQKKKYLERMKHESKKERG